MIRRNLSRDLNDTRYAARHIADYLRKYFDFSNSKRDDINEVSRIQLRSGGVTGFLRHMWGLDKIREENDLHHGLDALVIACSTTGHVYLVSNLAKEIERKGKNWYKHFGRDKFKPWITIREDIENVVKNIFVSRMQRHTVTGAAHDENPESLVEKRRIKKAKRKNNKKIVDSIPIKNRIIKFNKGYAEMGDIVRADVFVDEKGKNYVVPIYSVDIFSNKILPDKYLRISASPYDEWPSVKEDDIEFKFSIFKDDLISIDGSMYYVDFVGGTRSNISVRNIDGSNFESTNSREREFGYRNVELKKYSVDMLGTTKEIKQEKRLGNRFENKKMAQS